MHRSVVSGELDTIGRVPFGFVGATVGRIQKKKVKKKPKSADSGRVEPAKQESSQKAAAEPGSSNGKAIAKKKPVVISRPAPPKPKDSFITKSLQFLREVKVELKKVTWPSRKQTLGSTVVVLILVSIIAFFLGAVDIGLSSLVKVVLQ
jgi:preprotein translocase subunit SecE